MNDNLYLRIEIIKRTIEIQGLHSYRYNTGHIVPIIANKKAAINRYVVLVLVNQSQLLIHAITIIVCVKE